jgi:hypothetical protein
MGFSMFRQVSVPNEDRSLGLQATLATLQQQLLWRNANIPVGRLEAFPGSLRGSRVFQLAAWKAGVTVGAAE